MMLAAQIGLSRSEWEDMTPRELSVWAHAFSERRDAERHTAEVRIYNLAALTRIMIWGKQAPRFESVFPDRKKPQETMTDEQMFEQVRRLNALFGGEEE